MSETVSEKKERLFSEFEKMGESEVSIRYSNTPGYSANIDTPYAQEWLRLQQEKRDLISSAKRDAREEETLSIARRALGNSARANKISICAIVLAIPIAIIVTIIGHVFFKP